MQDRAVEAVDHHRAVDVLEDAGLDELHLAAAALLGRRPDDLDAALGELVSTAASAAPAPAPEVAMTLWPHAWPMPGSASYSHRMAMVGPSPVSMVARNAVSTPPTPVSTLKPCGEELAEPAAGLLLLVGQLGMIVDPAGEGFELVGEAVDGLRDGILEGAHGSLRHDGGQGDWAQNRKKSGRVASSDPPRPGSFTQRTLGESEERRGESTVAQAARGKAAPSAKVVRTSKTERTGEKSTTSPRKRATGAAAQLDGVSAGRRPGRRRQLDHEHRAAAGPVLGPEPAIVLGHHAVGDGQPQPAPLAGPLGGEEGIEDAGQIVGSTPGPSSATSIRTPSAAGRTRTRVPDPRAVDIACSAFCTRWKGPPGAGCCRPRSRAPPRTRSAP